LSFSAVVVALFPRRSYPKIAASKNSNRAERRKSAMRTVDREISGEGLPRPLEVDENQHMRQQRPAFAFCCCRYFLVLPCRLRTGTRSKEQQQQYETTTLASAAVVVAAVAKESTSFTSSTTKASSRPYGSDNADPSTVATMWLRYPARTTPTSEGKILPPRIETTATIQKCVQRMSFVIELLSSRERKAIASLLLFSTGRKSL